MNVTVLLSAEKQEVLDIEQRQIFENKMKKAYVINVVPPWTLAKHWKECHISALIFSEQDHWPAVLHFEWPLRT